jgi:aminopeptidase
LMQTRTHERPPMNYPANFKDPRAHEARFGRLAETAIRVGLNLAPGQELVMTAPLDGLPLARLISDQAYKAGASLVTTLITDDALALSRFQHAPDESFDKASGWLFEGMAAAFRSGAARLAVVGDDPTLLAAQDPVKVGRANRARSKAYRPALELITDFAINWTLVASATPAWAKAVFPADTPEVATSKLWEAIFAASRVNSADPVSEWTNHNRALHARKAYLNDKRYAALRFRGPGTELKVGLADGHDWCGGAAPALNGIVCNPNIPTEEVFTTPHAQRCDGYVRSTKPLSHQGTLIEGIEVRFSEGRVVEARATKGEAVLTQMLDTDEGARRLGEVALVPHSSPISQSGLLFQNTLFDENAASHIALGQAYSKCIIGGGDMEEDELKRHGANRSLIHVDWMIGSAEIDVDGLDAGGKAEPVMR